MEELKKMVIKAQKFDAISENIEKHTKGFIYDSLVYRYQLARYKAIQVDVHEGMSLSTAKSLYERDVMRFIQILDEVMGEHD
mgnify:CR=1 FL=1|jgi:hypothetical protein